MNLKEIFILLYIFSTTDAVSPDMEDLEAFLNPPMANHQLYLRNPWMTWNEKVDEDRYIRVHESDMRFNVTVENKNFIATLKDFIMWLKYTQKLIVVRPRTDFILEKFLKVYTIAFKYIYKGTVRYMDGQNSATIMADFESIGKTLNITPNYEESGDCNFIKAILNKYANNSTMFVMKNSMPNNYIVDRLNIHMRHYKNLRVLVLTQSMEWDTSTFHFVVIDGFKNYHSENDRKNSEFLIPDNLNEKNFRSEWLPPVPMDVKDYIWQFIHKSPRAN